MGNFLLDTTRRWPNGKIPFAFAAGIDVRGLAFDISAPVGAGVGGNIPGDVEKVQILLNKIEPSKGGPIEKLAITRKADAATIAAIRRFQQNRFQFDDGRVDPSGPTLIELSTDVVDNSNSAKGLILNAVHQWNRQVGGNIKWHRKLNASKNFVLFQSADRNTSSIGMKGGQQQINFNLPGMLILAGQFGCTVNNIFIHEMGHAAGMGHEQQRNDRNRFVRISFDNVAEGRRCDFSIPPDAQCSQEFLPTANIGGYDFTSTMHYFRTQASKSPTLATVTAIGPDGKDEPNKRMGGFDGLSVGDISTLTQSYPN